MIFKWVFLQDLVKQSIYLDELYASSVSVKRGSNSSQVIFLPSVCPCTVCIKSDFSWKDLDLVYLFGCKVRAAMQPLTSSVLQHYLQFPWNFPPDCNTIRLAEGDWHRDKRSAIERQRDERVVATAGSSSRSICSLKGRFFTWDINLNLRIIVGRPL